MIATVRIRAVLEQPFERDRIQGFARSEDDREVPVPQGVHVRAVRHEQRHHRDAMPVERSTHERRVSALMDVGSVLDHPPRHGEPRGRRRPPGNTAFSHPGERPVLAVAERRTVQRRIARHQRLDAIDVVGVDRLFELPYFLEGLDVRLELRPAREAILPGDLELCVRDRGRLSARAQIPGLVLQMTEIGTFGQRHGETPFITTPASAHSG